MVPDSATVTTDIRADVRDVWRCLTVGRSAWWAELRFEAAVGSPLVETWVEDGRRASATGTVTRCEAPHLLGFTWTEERWDGPLSVVIDLVAHEDSTSVVVTESGFARARTPESVPAEHEAGWRYHLTRLARVSEGHAVDGGTP